MIDAILLHIVSNLSSGEVKIGIIPKFQIKSTQFECVATTHESVVDFLIVKGPFDDIGKYKMLKCCFVICCLFHIIIHHRFFT